MSELIESVCRIFMAFYIVGCYLIGVVVSGYLSVSQNGVIGYLSIVPAVGGMVVLAKAIAFEMRNARQV